jgi:hypothetical protein
MANAKTARKRAKKEAARRAALTSTQDIATDWLQPKLIEVSMDTAPSPAEPTLAPTGTDEDV